MNVILHNRSAEHAARLFSESQCADIAVEVLLGVSQASLAIRAAEEGNPLRADDLSYFENFSEAIGIAPESPLTLSVLKRALPVGIESESDEKHIRFSVPDGFNAELVSAGAAVGLKVSSSEDPQKPILLVHDDLKIYADFVRPGLFAAHSGSSEHEALLRILTDLNDTLGRWISGVGIRDVIGEEDPEVRFRICSAVRWTWEDWDKLGADLESAEGLIKHVGTACSQAGDIDEVLISLEAKAALIREFRLLVTDRMDDFTRN